MSSEFLVVEVTSGDPGIKITADVGRGSWGAPEGRMRTEGVGNRDRGSTLECTSLGRWVILNFFCQGRSNIAHL